MSDQRRSSAWLILRWAELIYIDTILIENVPEFIDWGPVGANGQALKSRKGVTFRAFVGALQSLGYRVDWRVLNAADYGAATTRQRLFIQARRGRAPIVWPAASHSKTGGRTLFGKLEKWRPARDIIDWSLPGKSIFDRPRPLRATTMARIIAGLEQFSGPELHPFIAILRNHAAGRRIEPLPAAAASGTHAGLAQPFVLGHRQFNEMCVDSVDRPLRTITAKGGTDIALVRPFIIQLTHGGRTVDPDKPLPAITCANRGEMAVVSPFVFKYCSTGGARSVDDPLDTITTRDRFGLVTPLWLRQPDGSCVGLDIDFRMFTPRELARAMSFPDHYRFAGNRGDVVRQIGNAVDGKQAEALCEAVLA